MRNKESVQGGPGLADRAGWPPAERAAENPHSRNSTRNSGKLRFFGGFRAGCLGRSASDRADFASVGLPPLVIQQSGNDLRLRFVCGALRNRSEGGGGGGGGGGPLARPAHPAVAQYCTPAQATRSSRPASSSTPPATASQAMRSKQMRRFADFSRFFARISRFSLR